MYEELIGELHIVASGVQSKRRRELLEKAADAIEELQQKWIPVTERLPDVWSDVLVAGLKHRPKSEPVRTMAVDFITMTGEWAKMSCDWRNEVTHWMPLPTPPKEETE